METIQEFVDRTKGPLVPYVDSWYPWVYAHHYLRTEMHLLPPDLGVVGPRMLLDEVVELIQVWCGLTGESIEGSARALADAYLERWGVSREQIARARQQRLSVPVVPAEPGQRNQAPVPRSPRGNRVNGGRGAERG